MLRFSARQLAAQRTYQVVQKGRFSPSKPLGVGEPPDETTRDPAPPLPDARPVRSKHRHRKHIARDVGADSLSTPLVERLATSSLTPSSDVVRRDDQRRHAPMIVVALANLSEMERTVLKLRFVDGRTSTEVAELLGYKSEAVVNITVSRARNEPEPASAFADRSHPGPTRPGGGGGTPRPVRGRSSPVPGRSCRPAALRPGRGCPPRRCRGRSPGRRGGPRRGAGPG